MKLLMYLSLALLFVVSTTCAEQQRILRRVIKSTPTASNLGRIRQVTVRSVESGGVSEISSKEAASFGLRSANETSTSQVSSPSGTKTKAAPTSTSTSTTTTPSTTTTTTSTTTTSPSSTSDKPAVVEQRKNKASERQQAGPEVELLSGAPTSWQTMTAVEAPAAMLIATGTRAAVSSDLSSSASSHEEASDFLRSSSGTKGGSSRTSVGETFSRIRQQQQQQVVRQQNYFRPAPSKTAPVQATKTHWYQTSSTTPRPAPLVQQQEQQYEQQSEQYVEQQQQQAEYGAAPLGQAEPFAFDFKTEDQSGNGQYRKEESDQNGVVRGSYGYTDANGIYRHVDYVADQNGFRANIKSNEPGLIGETQPASIQLANAPAPRQASSPAQYVDQGENWQTSNKLTSADLALAPPDFESSHKSERVPRHYRH